MTASIRRLLYKYDAQVLSGVKTYLTIALLVASVLIIPVGKLQYFVQALALAHLFVLRVAK